MTTLSPAVRHIGAHRESAADVHYTPAELARDMVDAVAGKLDVTTVCDLAAGDGSLLRQARERWPLASVIASDIDTAAVRRLRRKHPDWLTSTCDLRNPRSVVKALGLLEAKDRVSLLLLNPPFSCRGGTSFPALLSDGKVVRAGAALSFVLLALPYLMPSGAAVVLMPSGSLESTKDYEAWSVLRRRFHVRVIRDYPKGTFPSSAARTTLVSLWPCTSADPPGPQKGPDLRLVRDGISVRLVRGTYPMHLYRQARRGMPLVHTTDMTRGRVRLDRLSRPKAFRVSRGPAVLLPRVGRISIDKIAVLDSDAEAYLSDCVIALETTSMEKALTLQRRLASDVNVLADQYAGTGAPYVTLERLRRFLGSVGGFA